MALAPGTRLGPYEVVAPVGAGGMGEVYRARDTRLDRDVAIKVLPSELCGSADRRQRFEREARAVAALSHSNICALHDIGSQNGVDFLVMEFIDGETLDQRLSRGPLPPEQLLRIGSQIADALDKAHRRGILHRDLKPANIMLTKSGAKLLDFGLAKPLASQSATISTLQTLASSEMTATGVKPLTREGTIVGTFQYMAPEQLEGREADARSDIWALGTVLYEMATGKQAFAGKTTASVMAAVLASEPPPIVEVQPLAPRALEHVVRRALAKDPDERWQSAADVKAELDWVAETLGSRTDVSAPVGKLSRRNRVYLWTALAVLALLCASALLFAYRSLQQSPRLIYSTINPPPKLSFETLSNEAAPPELSPDGTLLVFGAGGSLWLYSLSDGSYRQLPGTEGARWPFWAPNSRSVGFFSSGRLRVMDTAGGSPVALADAPNPRGAAWSPDGTTIVFAPATRVPIVRVSATGGPLKPITKVDNNLHTTHRWPTFLPDGKHIMYLAANHSNPRGENSGVYVSSLDGGDAKLVVRTIAGARYSAGMLLYVRENSLVAQPFDESKLALTGEPQLVADRVFYDSTVWRGVFTTSENGMLAYQPGSSAGPAYQLVWHDRSGKEQGTVGPKGAFFAPRLSHNNRRLGVGIGDPNADLWVYELESAMSARLTFEGQFTSEPIWSPDDTLLAYSRAPSSEYEVISIRRSDGSGQPREITRMETIGPPTDWSPDGRYLICDHKLTMWLVPVQGNEKPRPFIEPLGQADTYGGRFSPDGKWLAYVSEDTGRQEIYVSPFPQGGGRWQISTEGGRWPQWTRGGKELIYITPDNTLVAVEIDAKSSDFAVRKSERLFRISPAPGLRTGMSAFAVTNDGNRFLVNRIEGIESAPITLVTNWTSKLKK